MRLLNNVLVLALFTTVVSTAAFAAGQYPPRATSGNPTPLADGRVVGSAEVNQRGQLVDVSNFKRWTGETSIMTRPSTYVIRDQSDWTSAWRRAGATPPFVFPENEMAIAIFIGPKTERGYSAGVVSVRQDGENMFVTYITNKPAVLSRDRVEDSPWIIHMLPPLTGRVRFVAAGG